MFKIPLQDIINKIKEKTNLSEAEINSKISQKLEQLSGLISKEGAAHIIANELGVKIFEQVQGKLQIKNILAGMRNVETVGKVQRVFELREFQRENRTGKVASLVMADETGSIRIVMWGDQAEKINQIKENDILKINNGYVRENQGRKEVHLNDRAAVVINPPGVEINNVVEAGERPQAVRKKIVDLQQGDDNAEVLGTIVQVFEPKFFEVDPASGKRARANDDGKFYNNNGVEIKPDYSYVMNVVLDDGSETIRCAFFRNQVERLLNKTQQELLKYKDNIAEFETVKTDLLGQQVKLVGRAVKNEMFDRVEFITQLVFLNPDPQEEVQKLEKEQHKEEVKTEVENIN
jgi:replication factor A1